MHKQGIKYRKGKKVRKCECERRVKWEGECEKERKE